VRAIGVGALRALELVIGQDEPIVGILKECLLAPTKRIVLHRALAPEELRQARALLVEQTAEAHEEQHDHEQPERSTRARTRRNQIGVALGRAHRRARPAEGGLAVHGAMRNRAERNGPRRLTP
jgi:hypothetical protein